MADRRVVFLYVGAKESCRIQVGDVRHVSGTNAEHIANVVSSKAIASFITYSFILLGDSEVNVKQAAEVVCECAPRSSITEVLVLDGSQDALLQAYPFFSIPLADLANSSSESELVWPHRVDERIFLGCERSARNPYLRHMGIRRIVNAACYGLTAQQGVEYAIVNIADSEACDISAHFDRVTSFMDEAHREGHSVLSHCAAGVSRSTSLVLAWMMRYKKLTLREAYTKVRKQRSFVCPNSGFVKQLLQYEKQLLGQNSLEIPSFMRYVDLAELVRLAEAKEKGMAQEDAANE